MGYKVIIAEKPSVAGSIAKIVGATTPHRNGPSGYLEGNGWRVTWAFGHLVGLKTPEQMGFDRTTLPMFPEKWDTKILGKRGKDGKEATDPMVDKQMKTIDTLFSNADSIIVATDAGREGELIFRYIYEYLGCRTPFHRLWISSLTDEAIRKGLNEVKTGNAYNALSDAAHARSEADWLVGFNASRALRFSTGYKGNLSLGRVQTPTLGMICERYEQFKNFVPTPFWQISVDTEKNGSAFTVLSDGRYDSQQKADDDKRRVDTDGRLRVDKVEKKQTATKPPLLYDLTALQRAANGKYGLTADETLKTAQGLYEKKFLSYPRTGSRYIPDDVFKTIPGLLKKMSSYGTIGAHANDLEGKKLCRKSVNDAKVTDHHALLPTGNIPSGLDDREQKIFNLVLGRMIEAFGEDYIADVTTIQLSGGGVIFKVRGSVPVRPGWKAVYGTDTPTEGQKMDDDEEDNGRLPELREGDILPVNKSEVLEKTDKPLPIYTDSSLLGEMETCGKKIEDEELRESMKDVGLGTPATRAATIEALIFKNYVARDGKKLVPTEFGLMIWKMVKGRKIADVKTTGEWERDLAKVEHGQMNVRDFNSGIHTFVEDIISDLRQNCTPLDNMAGAKEPTRTCPVCGRPMKNQKFSITCDAESGGCGFRISREIAGKKLPDTAINALASGKNTNLIKGFTSKTGKKFDCRLKVDRENRKVAFDITSAASAPAREYRCPFCGNPMTRDGAKYVCSCGFEIWTVMCGVRLSEEQMDTIMKGGKTPVYGMKSKAGKTFNANIFINREKKKTDFEFDSTKKK